MKKEMLLISALFLVFILVLSGFAIAMEAGDLGSGTGAGCFGKLKVKVFDNEEDKEPVSDAVVYYRIGGVRGGGGYPYLEDMSFEVDEDGKGSANLEFGEYVVKISSDSYTWSVSGNAKVECGGESEYKVYFDTAEFKGDDDDDDDDNEGRRVKIEKRIREDGKEIRVKIERIWDDEGNLIKEKIEKRIKDADGNEIRIIVRTENGKNIIEDDELEIEVESELEVEFEEELEDDNSISNETNKTKMKVKLKNGKGAEIKIMPSTASERALERLRLKVCSEENGCTIVLKEVGKGDRDENEVEVEYELETERPSKILGVIKKKMKVKANVDAFNGMVDIDKPWWAWLASEEDLTTETETTETAETIE